MSDSSGQFDVDNALQLLAAKLSVLPDTMAWIIERYKQTENVDDEQVRRYLEIDPSAYYHLAICGRPRSDLFDSDIETLSERFKIPEEPLVRMVRRVEAISTFRDYRDVATGSMLSAARDIAEEPPTPYRASDEDDGPDQAVEEPEDAQ
jgi:hypothetical protein